MKEIVQSYVGHGILVLGDFNERSDAPGLRSLLDTGLVDLGSERNMNTVDNARIDYLLVDNPLARLTAPARVWATDKSDHHGDLRCEYRKSEPREKDRCAELAGDLRTQLVAQERLEEVSEPAESLRGAAMALGASGALVALACGAWLSRTAVKEFRPLVSPVD